MDTNVMEIKQGRKDEFFFPCDILDNVYPLSHLSPPRYMLLNTSAESLINLPYITPGQCVVHWVSRLHVSSMLVNYYNGSSSGSVDTAAIRGGQEGTWRHTRF